MVVALKEASANGTTFFGLNHYAPLDQRHRLHLNPGRMHDPGEMARTATLALPQARRTCAVLGLRDAGAWGYLHGINEHRVAIGVTDWHSRLGQCSTGGSDLVRLALERSHGAHHAVEVLTDLLEHQASYRTDGANVGGGDHIYLIADPNEAFVLEASGRYWALLECGHTRVVTDAGMIRQDWRRLAPGLARFVVEHGWWEDDGSKIDFVGCLSDSAEQVRHAQRRWGRASLALAQQHGAIDLHYLRRMLGDHYSQNRDRFVNPQDTTLASSFLVEMPHGDLPVIAWVAFGAPKVSVHFPICMSGELPHAFFEEPTLQQRTLDLQPLAVGRERDRTRLAAALELLQNRFDEDAEEFLAKCQDCLHHGRSHHVRQLASAMMLSHVEQFEKECRRLLGQDEPARQPVAEAEELLYFA